ncbi:MAG: tripartite tricarboxylate transporter substrate binding protein [Caldimonas sp.]
MNPFRSALLLCAVLVAAVPLRAETFPDKPITLVVPFATGASADGIARIVAAELQASLGKPVVVENRPGGGGATALIMVSKAPADGYTIAMGATGALVINPHLPDSPPLKPETQLAPLAKVADIPLVFVAGAKSGIGSVAELIERSRAKPDSISYGSTGVNTAQHLSAEMLAAMAKIRMTHVPYRGSGPAVSDVIGGQIPVAVVDLTSAYPHIKAGTLVALGVTSPARSKTAPEIRTIAESGLPGYAATAWMGMFAPAGTPPGVVARLSQEIHAALDKPEIQARLLALAVEPAFLGPDDFGRFIAAESKKWGALVKPIGAAK